MAESENTNVKNLDMSSEAPADLAPPAVIPAATPEATYSTDGVNAATAPAEPAGPVVIPAKPFMATPPVTPVSTPVSPSAKAQPGWHKYVHLVVEVILLLVIVALALQLLSARSESKSLRNQITTLQSNPLLVAQKKTDDTIAAVSRLTTVPQGDAPTVTEVTDATAVKKSIAGLTDVQNGDKLLFYVKGSRFIQYRPSTDKILINQPLTVK